MFIFSADKRDRCLLQWCMSTEFLSAVAKCTHIVCHDACPDGTASAILLHDALPNATIEFVQYETDRHKTMEAKPNVLFCDFSPHKSRVQEFVDCGAIVLDHHRTAKTLVEAFGSLGRFGDEATQPGVSGAWLAYEHVWKPLRGLSEETYLRTWVENFARTAGVRDTWQTKNALWRASCVQAYVLNFLPQQRWLDTPLTQIISHWSSYYMEVGETIFARHEKDVQKAIDKGYHITTPRKGWRVVMIPSTSLISDAAEMLGDTVDLVVGFGFAYETKTDDYPKLTMSIRSHTTFDCGSFVTDMQLGGGHTRAAGGSLPLAPTSSTPYEEIRQLLQRYEQKLVDASEATSDVPTVAVEGLPPRPYRLPC